MAFACIGNRAKVISGDAKGAIGYVSGKHGGIDHVLICFPKADLENMAVNDQILIYAHGQGLKLLEHEEIHVMNIDPALLKQIPIQEDKAYLSVPVVTKVPRIHLIKRLCRDPKLNTAQRIIDHLLPIKQKFLFP